MTTPAPRPVLPVLYYHPLSSYCHKLLIALELLGVDFERRVLNLGDAEERTAFQALWPTGKMPLLVDQGRPVAETSIIIEHLQLHHAQPGRRLIPPEPEAALQVRLWDRLFDLYVMAPMQACTADLLRPEGQRDAYGAAQARAQLLAAYGWIDRHLQGRPAAAWVASEAFSLADCAAAPALFYAVAFVPIPPGHPHLAGYLERLMDHPAVAGTVDQARPYFRYFPGRAGLASRYFDPAQA